LDLVAHDAYAAEFVVRGLVRVFLFFFLEDVVEDTPLLSFGLHQVFVCCVEEVLFQSHKVCASEFGSHEFDKFVDHFYEVWPLLGVVAKLSHEYKRLSLFSCDNKFFRVKPPSSQLVLFVICIACYFTAIISCF
jgi:hypothetical protein